MTIINCLYLSENNLVVASLLLLAPPPPASLSPTTYTVLQLPLIDRHSLLHFLHHDSALWYATSAAPSALFLLPLPPSLSVLQQLVEKLDGRQVAPDRHSLVDGVRVLKVGYEQVICKRQDVRCE